MELGSKSIIEETAQKVTTIWPNMAIWAPSSLRFENPSSSGAKHAETILGEKSPGRFVNLKLGAQQPHKMRGQPHDMNLSAG